MVGAPTCPGVLVFDLSAGGPPTCVPWPVGLSPVDMVAAPDGDVWILDDQPGPGGWPRYWCLDRHLRIGNLAGVVPSPRARPSSSRRCPPPGPATPPGPGGLAGDGRGGVGRGHRGAPDGSVLVLDRGRRRPARVLLLRGEERLGQLPLAPLVEPVDFAFTPDPGGGEAGTLYVAEHQGDQAFAYRLAASARRWRR